MLNSITYEIGKSAVIVDNMAIGVHLAETTSFDEKLPDEINREINNILCGKMAKFSLRSDIENSDNKNPSANDIPSNRIFSFVFNIRCSEKNDIIAMMQLGSGEGNLWINGIYIGPASAREILKYSLSEGNNVFCYVCNGYVDVKKLYVRINSVANEMHKEYASAIVENYCTAHGKVDIIDLKYQWYMPKEYAGVLYSYDWFSLDIDQELTIQVVDFYSPKVYYEGKGSFYKPFFVPLDNLEHFDDKLNFYLVRVWYEYSDGRKSYVEKFFSFEPVEVSKEKIYKEFQSMINTPGILECIKIDLTKCYNSFQDKINNSSNISRALHVFKWQMNVISDPSHSFTEYKSGAMGVCYFSKLDNTVSSYSIILPRNFCRSNRYPLIIHYATTQYDDPSSFLSDAQLDCDVIIANVHMRGVTLGSYIGEAGINEVIADIKSRFLIDDDRVSAFGYSNGASAAWIQAQLTPDRFGMIAPCGGTFNGELICNLNNVSVLDIESSADVGLWNRCQIFSNELSSLKDYTLAEIEGYTHGFLIRIYLNNKTMRLLANSKINRYPYEIKFIAITNRHLSAYWVRMHAIEDNSPIGAVHACVLSYNTIRIGCVGITGLTIDLPPQITDDTVHIFVNEIELDVEITGERCVSIIKDPETGLFTLGNENKDNFKLYHGFGLLDVFLTPVRIINCNKESEQMCKSARAFSSPTMNTYNNKVAVNYPIYAEDSIVESEIRSCSLIVLDNNTTSEFACRIRQNCVIETDKTGFVYMGQRYEGEYCVMQITKHPKADECNILYINSNNDELYQKNLFTRSIIIPTCVSSRHPYLSNAALIYYEDKYYAVFEYGCVLCEIKSHE